MLSYNVSPQSSGEKPGSMHMKSSYMIALYREASVTNCSSKRLVEARWVAIGTTVGHVVSHSMHVALLPRAIAVLSHVTARLTEQKPMVRPRADIW